MKVLLINGSPHADGCTFTALHEVEKALNKSGIDTEIFHIGTKPIAGCTACGHCKKSEKSRCVFDNDTVNKALCIAETADAFIFGSPVYFASPNGSMISFLDRFFRCGSNFANKPGACVVSARRAGTTAALEVLNKYPTIANMPLVSSCYWPMVHGNTPQEVVQDLEGMRIMHQLGYNMAWLLNCIQAGKDHGVALPETEPRVATNFIR